MERRFVYGLIFDKEKNTSYNPKRGILVHVVLFSHWVVSTLHILLEIINHLVRSVVRLTPVTLM